MLIPSINPNIQSTNKPNIQSTIGLNTPSNPNQSPPPTEIAINTIVENFRKESVENVGKESTIDKKTLQYPLYLYTYSSPDAIVTYDENSNPKLKSPHYQLLKQARELKEYDENYKRLSKKTIYTLLYKNRIRELNAYAQMVIDIYALDILDSRIERLEKQIKEREHPGLTELICTIVLLIMTACTLGIPPMSTLVMSLSAVQMYISCFQVITDSYHTLQHAANPNALVVAGGTTLWEKLKLFLIAGYYVGKAYNGSNELIALKGARVSVMTKTIADFSKFYETLSTGDTIKELKTRKLELEQDAMKIKEDQIYTSTLLDETLDKLREELDDFQRLIDAAKQCHDISSSL